MEAEDENDDEDSEDDSEESAELKDAKNMLALQQKMKYPKKDIEVSEQRVRQL